MDFIKHTQVTLVQPSIKVKNHRDPLNVGTLDGPQTSECITIKGTELLFKLNRNESRWLFASSQTSHLKLLNYHIFVKYCNDQARKENLIDEITNERNINEITNEN